MLTKNTFVEEMRKQYVLVARAKGLSQPRVLWKHILRNALVPLVTAVGGPQGVAPGGSELVRVDLTEGDYVIQNALDHFDHALAF